VRRVEISPAFDSWRDAARALLAARVDPADIVWDDGIETFLPFAEPEKSECSSVRLPQRFLEIAERVSAHRGTERWSLLYQIAFRLLYEDKQLLQVVIDDDVHRLHELDQEVRRDVHKMHAFVRFKLAGDAYIAWYRPDHQILRLAVPFFVDRFRSMQWSILTPDESVYWNGSETIFGPGVGRDAAPEGDALESLWRTYYRSMFNPARTNLKKMRADMPSRFWNDMPELRDVPQLVSAASSRVGSMIHDQRSATSAGAFLPAERDIDSLRLAASRCEGCPLHERATQTVFGEGPVRARIVMVGEQPGDQEDRRGRPFVGPAGEVLDRAIEAAGLDRSQIYMTNAVKHFAWIERGKQRIHRTPRQIEVTACRPWLDAELAAIDPELIVALGATASRSLLGSSFRLMQQRGQFHKMKTGRRVLPTIHPSAVLRVDYTSQDSYFQMLVDDLSIARLASPLLYETVKEEV
jgi:uracil-DNA glycosylase